MLRFESRHFSVWRAFVTTTLTAGSIAWFSGCSGVLPEKQDKKKSNAAAPGLAAADANAEGATTTTLPASNPVSFAIGIPSHCVTSGSSDTQFCLICKPRELEVGKCHAVEAGINPTEQCQHSRDEILCKDTSGKELVRHSLKPNSVEDLYEGLPLYLLAAQGLLAAQLKDKPKEMALATAMLDFVQQNSEAIFKGREPATVAKNLTAAIKTAQPQLTEAQLSGIETAATSAFTDLAPIIKSGQLDIKSLSAMLIKLIDALPFQSIGGGSSRIDLEKIRAVLSSSADGKNVIEEVIKALGLENLGDLIKLLQPNKTQLRLLGSP